MTTETRSPAILDRRKLIATELRNGAGLRIELLANGSVFAIRHGDVLVNQVLGSPVEGAIGNIYIRRRTRHGISSFPLLGPAAPSRFSASEEGAAWEGAVDGLDYSCTLLISKRAFGEALDLDQNLVEIFV